MTNETLQKIAKQHKVNLEHFDEVNAFININYTYVFVTFAARENLGGTPYRCCETTCKMLVFSILKREEDPTEYCTNGWEWISDIKARKSN